MVGGVPSSVGGVLLVVEHFWTWYRRNWRATFVSSIVQPLLFLLAFGVGFGALLAGGGQAGAATGGLSYLVWLAPALLTVSAVQTATFESTYPVLSCFKWQRTYHGMAAGPLTPGQIALGHVTWTACKTLITGTANVAAIVLFGGAAWIGIVAALGAAVLTGATVAALVTAFAARVENEGGAFNALFRFGLVPMILFSGTFFPADRLPGWVQPLTWVSPLWHGTEVARGSALGKLALLPALGHLGYLAALFALGMALAVRFYRRRLAP